MALFKREPKPEPKKPSAEMPKLAGGRISTDGWRDGWYSNAYSIVEPDDYDQDWRMLELDERTLDKVDVNTLMDMLADISPDVSRAIWDFERMLNPGWEYKAYKGDPDAEPDAAGQAALDAFMETLKERYKAVDVVWNRLFMGAYMRGAFCAELVLDKKGRTPLDLATPDPASIRFRKVKDPVLGYVYIPGQWQSGNKTEFILLDRPTFAYVPVDSMPGRPYGRPPVRPALFTSLFLIGMLHDLRRVISQQGYPRIDIMIDLEKLAAAMPAELEGDPDAFMKWVNDIVDEVTRVYSNLQPDDAYVHTSTIEVNRPVGTVDANSLGAIEGIIKALERMSIRALKTMPLLMGINEASTETHAARQWEVYVAGVKSLQHLAENMLESLLKLALRAQGIQCNVRFRFAELRVSEELRDQQTLALKISNVRAQYEAGWLSQDAASVQVTGKPADAPEPRQAATGSTMEKANDTMAANVDNDPESPLPKEPTDTAKR